MRLLENFLIFTRKTVRSAAIIVIIRHAFIAAHAELVMSLKKAVLFLSIMINAVVARLVLRLARIMQDIFIPKDLQISAHSVFTG
jgi:hypothetical protein